VTSQDSGAGAPRAIHRIFRALRDHFAHRAETILRVVHKSINDDAIIGGKPRRSRLEHFEYLLRTRFRKYFPRQPYLSENKLLHSQALYPSGLGRELNQLCPDVILLGWLGNSTLSIREIGKLRAPVVWRLSDMWMFSGAEHYTSHPRYEQSYSRRSRPPTESGPDINRETFLRKKRSWRKPSHVICPSHWMADQAKASRLTRGWPVHVIPNAINPADWEPVPTEEARIALKLPLDREIILFGAGSGLKDFHKGGDLFLESLRQLPRQKKEKPPPLAAIFGQEGDDFVHGHAEVSFLGRLNDNELRLAYSAADVMVVPSRIDNYPSTAVEAQTTGCPVIAFRTGGLPDIIENGITGLLVEPFSTARLAEEIVRVSGDISLNRSMRARARERAVELWNPTRIAGEYLRVLEQAASNR